MNDTEIRQALDNISPYSNDIVMVPLGFILRNAESSCDFGDVDQYADETHFWTYLVENKARDTGFGHLVEAILEEGWQQGSAIGFDGDCITEGHHRLAAAILLCIEEVPISPWGKSGRDNLCAHWNDDAYGIHL